MAALIAPEPQHSSTAVAPRRGEAHGLVHEQRAARAGHEHAGPYRASDAREVRPPDHVLQRLAGEAAREEVLQRRPARGLREQDLGLVLREHAPRGAQPRGDARDGVARCCCGHDAP